MNYDYQIVVLTTDIAINKMEVTSLFLSPRTASQHSLTTVGKREV